jgi:hypothetical protein
MKIRRTAHFDRKYTRAPQEIQQAFDKQSLLLLRNPRHPSLRAKKYDEGKDRWPARVTRDWRFYLLIEGDFPGLPQVGRRSCTRAEESFLTVYLCSCAHSAEPRPCRPPVCYAADRSLDSALPELIRVFL